VTRALGLRPVGRPHVPPDPQVLTLHAMGLSFGQIAARLGYTRGKVSHIIGYARGPVIAPRKAVTLPDRHYHPKVDLS